VCVKRARDGDETTTGTVFDLKRSAHVATRVGRVRRHRLGRARDRVRSAGGRYGNARATRPQRSIRKTRGRSPPLAPPRRPWCALSGTRLPGVRRKHDYRGQITHPRIRRETISPVCRLPRLGRLACTPHFSKNRPTRGNRGPCTLLTAVHRNGYGVPWIRQSRSHVPNRPRRGYRIVSMVSSCYHRTSSRNFHFAVAILCRKTLPSKFYHISRPDTCFTQTTRIRRSVSNEKILYSHTQVMKDRILMIFIKTLTLQNNRTQLF